jgi:hypothetical protein
LESPAGALSRQIASGASDDQIVEDWHLAALARFPTEAEWAACRERLAEASQPEARREALVDIAWALLNSKHFAFNH